MTMALSRITTTPLVLSESDLKDHLRIDGVQDDAALDAVQRAAVAYIEKATNTQIGTGTFRLTLDRFDDGRGEIILPRPPLKSVEAIKYLDAACQEQVIDPITYKVDMNGQPGRIVLKAGQQWPATADEAGAVIIEFTAGSDQVPETIRHLIRLVVGGWWECREGTTDRRYDELPQSFAVSTLIQMHTMPEIV